jgi:DNA-binding IclR family transcriptional regulator
VAKSAVRVLEILEHVAAQRTGLTHAQIAQDLGIPKSSLTVLLRDLQDSGYAQLDADTARYSVGPQVLALAHAYLRSLNLARLGHPVVTQLYAAVNEFAALAIRKDDECVLICAESSPSPLAHSLQLGEHMPLLATSSGKVLLAYLDPVELNAVLRRNKPKDHTAGTLTEMRAIRADLERVRKTGIAYSREEYLAAITSIATPVFNAQGAVIAALSVALPSARLSAPGERKIVAALQKGAKRLSAQLGAQAAQAEAA